MGSIVRRETEDPRFAWTESMPIGAQSSGLNDIRAESDTRLLFKPLIHNDFTRSIRSVDYASRRHGGGHLLERTKENAERSWFACP